MKRPGLVHRVVVVASLVATVGLTILAAAGPAGASCAGDQTVAGTQVVKAGPPPSPTGQFTTISEERTYQVGQRYLALAPQQPATARTVPRSVPIATELASAMTDADKGGGGNGTLLLVVLGIVVIAGVCLWLLFRRGSIAHRADVDWPVDDDPAPDGSATTDDGPDGVPPAG